MIHTSFIHILQYVYFDEIVSMRLVLTLDRNLDKNEGLQCTPDIPK